jgi:hypothetical protein
MGMGRFELGKNYILNVTLVETSQLTTPAWIEERPMFGYWMVS